MALGLAASGSPATISSVRSSIIVPRAFLSNITSSTRLRTSTPPLSRYCLQFSSVLIRATSSEETTTDDSSRFNEVFSNLKSKWDEIDNKSLILIYSGGAVVTIWLSSIVLHAVDSVPLLPKVMELVGLSYSVWFTYRYLLFKENRKELASRIEDLKTKITGTDESYEESDKDETNI